MSGHDHEQLDVRLLGGCEVRLDGRALKIGGPQPRAVTAHLALAGGTVISAERMIDLLWDESPPATATGSLQSCISKLRQRLEPSGLSGLVASQGSGYRLDAKKSSIDVFRFDDATAAGRRAAGNGEHEAAVAQFDEALAVWRGEPLADLPSTRAFVAARSRLTEAHHDVIDRRFHSLLSLGLHDAVLPELHDAVAQQPLREARWEQLSLALYRAGRQAEALRAIESVRQVLAEEVGLSLSSGLRSLESRILAQDPKLHAESASASASAASSPTFLRRDPSPDPTAVHDDGAPLIGRRAQCESLRQALWSVNDDGAPISVVLEGEAGIGKSTLLDWLESEADRRGWAIARGSCLDGGVAPALWPWTEIATGITDEAAISVERPAMRQLLGQSRPEDRSTTLAEISAALVECLRVGRRPTVVVIDDFHWADAASAQLLSLLAKSGRRMVMLVVAHRPLIGNEPPAVVGALADLARAGRVIRPDMDPLDAAAIGELIRALRTQAPTDTEVAMVHERSGGNPLFAAELARDGPQAAAATVPRGIRDIVRGRLAALPPACAELLSAAAVVGVTLDLRLLAAATDRSLIEVTEALDVAVRAGLLGESPDAPIRFSHALVRDAVAAEQPPLRRSMLHHRIADAMDSLYGSAASHCEPVAMHRLAAGDIEPPATLIEALVRAAEWSRRRGALDRADELLESTGPALQRLAGDPAGIRLEVDVLVAMLDVANLRAFYGPRHEELAARFEALARCGSDEARMLGLAVRWSPMVLGHWDALEPLAEQALVLANSSSDPFVVAFGSFLWATQCWQRGRIRDSAEHYRAAVAADVECERIGRRRVSVDIAGKAAVALAVTGDLNAAEAAAERAVAWLESRSYFLDAAFVAALDAALRGDAESTARLIDDAAAGVLGDAHGLMAEGARILHGWAHATLEGSTDAARRAMQAMARIDATPVRTGRQLLRTFVADAVLNSGEPSPAIDMLDRVVADAGDEVGWLPEAFRLRAEARVLLDGPTPEAEDDLRRSIELADELGADLIAQRARRSSATLAALR